MIIGLGIATITCILAVVAADIGLFDGEEPKKYPKKESQIIMEDIYEKKDTN